MEEDRKKGAEKRERGGRGRQERNGRERRGPTSIFCPGT